MKKFLVYVISLALLLSGLLMPRRAGRDAGCSSVPMPLCMEPFHAPVSTTITRGALMDEPEMAIS